MNELQRKLMDKPPIERPYCPFCGKPWTERHHIIPRSQGGTSGPTVTVCGNGNTSGCHKLLHDHVLHLDFRSGRWVYLRTIRPMKYQDALELKGWRKI